MTAALDDLQSLVGTSYAGEWVTLDEARLEAFDHATFVSENSVEMDLDRYPDGLVEGFHLAAVVERLHREVLGAGDDLRPTTTAVAKVRFVSPVHTGERMRATGVVTAAWSSPEGVEVELDSTVEVEGRAKPGFVVRWRQRWSPAAPTPAADPAQPVEPVEPVEVTAPLAGFEATVGRPFGSGWLVVDADRQRSFAAAASAAGDPEPATHSAAVDGLHLVALLDHLVNPVVHPDGETWFGWNYGLDDVQLGPAVPVGRALRVTGHVEGVEPRGEGRLVRLHCSIHASGEPTPVLTGRWTALWLPEED